MSIQIKRGMKKDLPQLKDGELAFCRDTKELFVGNNGNENVNVTSVANETIEEIVNKIEETQEQIKQFENSFLPVSGGKVDYIKTEEEGITVSQKSGESTGNVSLNVYNNHARIRVGGDSIVTNNGFSVQGPGDKKWFESDLNGNCKVAGTLHTGSSIYVDVKGGEQKLGFMNGTNHIVSFYGRADGRSGMYDTKNNRTIWHYINSDNSMWFSTPLKPSSTNSLDLGGDTRRWKSIYLTNSPNVSSDRTLKENIEYVGKAKSNLTYTDMYNFVKDDLGLATYNFIGDDKLRMNFIAQDLLANPDGTDNKVGQMIVNPISPKKEDIKNGELYPTLNYDSGMYVSVLAGALKEAINEIEKLKVKINKLEENNGKE